MRLTSLMRGVCAVALGLLPGVLTAQHATGSYTQVVNKATPTLGDANGAVTSSLNPSQYTQNVIFTLTLPSDATGTVQFLDSGAALGTPVTITKGAGGTTYSITTLAIGTHPITATYSGDSNYAAATTKGTLNQVVNKFAGTLTITTSAPTSVFGSSVTFSTNTLPAGATGTVTFFDGGTSIGTGTANNGSASFSTSTLTVGTHPITATYGGDTNYAAITTSNTISQVVTKANTTSNVLTYSPASPTYGQQVTFTDTLPTNATGTITFKDGNTVLGTGTLVNGVATFTTTTPLSAGTHTITAVYPGDSNYSASTGTATVTVKQQTGETNTLTVDVNPAAAGTAVTFTAALPTDATGTVDFFDGATKIGTGNLSFVTGAKAATATFTTSTLTVGTHPITAVYNGDGNYSNVTSNAITETITAGTATLTISGVPNPSTYGQNVVMTITVTGVNNVAPTGTVQLSFGGNALGGALTLTPGTNGTSTATYNTSALPAGSDVITATYSGDSNYK